MLYMKKWLDLLDKNRDDMAIGFMSSPGVGKTTIINDWAREHDRKVVEIVLSQRMPSEISGMPMPINEERKMDVFDYDALLSLEDGDILFLDEFTNGNIQTLNACLTLIQDRTMLSGRKLPSIMVVAAGNPQGKCELLPQTKQRFMWVNVEWDSYMWKKYIMKKYGFQPDSQIITAIERTYERTFDHRIYNYMTARTAENIIRLCKTMREEGMDYSQVDALANSYKDLSRMVLHVFNIMGFKDQLTKVKEDLISFCEEKIRMYSGMIRSVSDELSWKLVKESIESAETMVDLKKMFSLTESMYEKDSPWLELIEYAKSTEL